MSGDGAHRHDDYRKIVWEVDTCEASSSTSCSGNAASDLEFLNKLEFVMFYNTERFNINDSSNEPIIRESYIEYYDFNPEKKYALKSVVNRGQVVDERGLFSQTTSDFVSFEAGALVESTDSTQQAYLKGEVSLSSDRTLVTRKGYTVMDLLSAVGGLALFLFVLFYIILAFYVNLEQKIYTIINLFYFSARFETKATKQPISYRVKAELGGRHRIDRPSFRDLICCRSGPFFSQIKQGHEKLKLRLDLAKFLEEQKFCKIALSGLLTPSQLLFCEK